MKRVLIISKLIETPGTISIVSLKGSPVDPAILTLNIGSSSIKFAAFLIPESRDEFRLDRQFSGKLERIGLSSGTFTAKSARGPVLIDRQLELKTHQDALKNLIDWIESDAKSVAVRVTGHRIVHGGARHERPETVDPALLRDLKGLVPLAPDHLPQEIECLEMIARLHPKLPQVVCFDTAFHRAMPRMAQVYGIPREITGEGVIRYGFHGLSYEYIIQELARQAGEPAACGRVIAAHLGNGCSLCAVHEGRSIDTTMGFTPTSGLVMSTRCGDLDPGAVLYLLEQKHLSPARVREILNKQAGLLGLSGLSSDMQDLIEKSKHDPRAEEAIAVFCYQARKHLGALAAALRGLETLVFTGGIGEHAAPVRQRICQGLEHLGIQLDSAANERNAGVISAPGSRATVRVIPTDEEAVIARHTLATWRR